MNIVEPKGMNSLPTSRIESVRSFNSFCGCFSKIALKDEEEEKNHQSCDTREVVQTVTV